MHACMHAPTHTHTHTFIRLIKSIASVLKSTIDRKYPRELDYHKVPHPWLQVSRTHTPACMHAFVQACPTTHSGICMHPSMHACKLVSPDPHFISDGDPGPEQSSLVRRGVRSGAGNNHSRRSRQGEH